MSFLQNDPASCGVNNAVNKLNNRVNGNNSVNQQLQYRNNQASGLQEARNQFNRLNRVDRKVQEEFHSFQNEISWQERPLDSFRFKASDSSIQPAQLGGSHQQDQRQQWVTDFQKLSIQDSRRTKENIGLSLQHGVQPKTGMMMSGQNAHAWSAEFSGITRRQEEIEGREDYIARKKIVGPISSFNQTYGVGQNINNGDWRYQKQSNLEESKERTDAAFESAFNEIEKHINTNDETKRDWMEDDAQEEANIQGKTENIESKNRTDESEKEKFADIAKSVFDAMEKGSSHASAKTNDKFKNSKFLHLMDQISKREVEINKTNDKFIDARGHDIRDDLPDPLRDLRDRNLYEGGPFEAAREISANQGQQISPGDWETDI
ncbi:DEBR0S6_11364g1_1 [Brettanomyces bruxellensis]|uniref:DEBR0S6_11364g1_1 n=1 Tax=Dekkera bruxellensis TaxID=5007 RepID=A0A7D9H5K9_DEKBR|nr:DEBR0S6_11364g1_1 [Brettanomyces bruxellensis]